MHMSFWVGTDLNDLLFKGLNISSAWGIFLVCAVLIVSVWLQQGLRLALAHAKASPKHAPCPDHTNLISTSFRRSPRWREMLSEAGLYVLEVVAAYLIMLVVMTYNTWLVVAVIFGYGSAYGALGHKMAALNHKPLIPCAHCIMAQSKYTNFGSSSSVGPSSTPVASQVDLIPPPESCCATNTATQASVHL